VRTLVPYYFVSTQPVGWKCSECGKLFQIKIALKTMPQDPMPEIKADFKAHKCEPKARAAKKG
jgi:hypothetical protein